MLMPHTETGKRGKKGWVEDHSEAHLVYIVLKICVHTQESYPLRSWLRDFVAHEIYNKDKDYN